MKWWTTAPGQAGWFWTRIDEFDAPKPTKIGWSVAWWKRWMPRRWRGEERRHYVRAGGFVRPIGHAHRTKLQWWPKEIQEPRDAEL